MEGFLATALLLAAVAFAASFLSAAQQTRHATELRRLQDEDIELVRAELSLPTSTDRGERLFSRGITVRWVRTAKGAGLDEATITSSVAGMQTNSATPSASTSGAAQVTRTVLLRAKVVLHPKVAP